MAKLFEVDENGASAVGLVTARERFDEGNVKAFGASLDTVSHAPQNQIAGINALVFTEVGEALLRAALWGASPGYARGIYLDALGGLLDIRRDQAIFTRVNAVLTGTAGTTVPAGSLARTDNGDQFRLAEAVVIQSGGTAGEFLAVESGPIECDAEALTGIVSLISGWTGVSNAEAGVIGRDSESDASYRANILSRTAQSSIGAVGALQSALIAAGASSVKVIENPTAAALSPTDATDIDDYDNRGVGIPDHSIFVIADGGEMDDVGRAIENHRGMGVGTYSAITGSATSLAAIQEITGGRLAWNGTNLTGFDFSTDSLNGVATKISAASSDLTMAASNDRLLAFYSWKPTTEGFTDIGGNPAESDGVTDLFRMVGAEYATLSGTTNVRVRFSDTIASHGSGSPLPVITYMQGGSEVTHDMTGTTQFWSGGNTFQWTLGTNIPSDATAATFTLRNNIRNRSNDEATKNVPIALTQEIAGSTDTPAAPQVYGVLSGDTSIRVFGWAFGTVTKWQYRRYENGDYLDNSWVDIPSSASQRIGNGLSGISITGLTAGLTGSRVDLRAVNGTHGTTAPASIVFDTTTGNPTVTAGEIDGQSIVLTLSRSCLDTYLTSNTGHWSVSKAGVSVSEQRSRGRKVYLKTNTAVLPTDTITLSYTTPGTQTSRIRSPQLNDMANFSNRALTNRTLAGVPASPSPVLLFQDGTGYRIDWLPNSNGGQTTDRYEYSISNDGGASFESWISAGDVETISIADTAVPDEVRVRGSNPNARTAETLGLLNIVPAPFMRSVARPLAVSMVVSESSNLGGNDLEAIRNALIARVAAYRTGATLRVAELQSAVELLPGVDIDSMTVTSGGAAVDGIAQNTYSRWTLDKAGIVIDFA